MAAATVKTAITEIGVRFGTRKFKIGYFTGVAKATQHDIIKITGIKELVKVISLKLDATGAWENHTVSGESITCTSATGSATVTGLVLYR